MRLLTVPSRLYQRVCSKRTVGVVKEKVTALASLRPLAAGVPAATVT